MDRVFGFERTLKFNSNSDFEFVSRQVLVIPMEFKFSKVYSTELIEYLRKRKGEFQLDYLDNFIIEASYIGYYIEDINEVFENDPVLADLDYFSNQTKLSIRSLTEETINRNKTLLADFDIPDGILLHKDGDDVYIDQYVDESVNLEDATYVLFQVDKSMDLMFIETYRYKHDKDN